MNKNITVSNLKAKKKHSSMDKMFYKIKKKLFRECFGAFSAKTDFFQKNRFFTLTKTTQLHVWF